MGVLETPARAETWRAVTFGFSADTVFPDPVRDCVVVATFMGPGGHRIDREAYWDGGSVYRVSFAAPAPGRWRWELSAPQESGLDALAAELDVVPYDGPLAIYRHGFLRVSDDGRYLCYDDGTPFFWLGDTHWEFAYGERWDESNHPSLPSMFRGMVDRRVDQGFSVYQTNLRADTGRGGELFWDAPAPGGDPLPNIAFFREELDRRMAYLADSGLVNAVGFGWNTGILGPGAQGRMETLARYMVARYGALPVVWTLAGEVASYGETPERRRELLDRWRRVARVVERCDGYGQLQTAHYTNERPFATYYRDEDWFDFTLNQAGHGDYVVSSRDYREFFSAGGASKPFVEGESMYELCSTLEENGPRLVTSAMVRRVAYTAMQCGACGYTYGAQGIWDDIWDGACFEDPMTAYLANMFNRGHVTWVDGIDAPGAAEMGIMRRFYLGQRFWELAPCETGGTTVLGRTTPLVTRNGDGTRAVAYYAETVRKPAVLDGVAPGPWELCWFDPSSGAWGPCGEADVGADGRLTLPGKPDGRDWLLTAHAAQGRG